ncbi:unnamed protein product, partial [Prorocentrum cordatum]
EVEEEEEREEEEAAGQMEEEEEEGEQQEEEKEVRRGHPRGRALFLPAVSCLGRAGGRRPGVPQGPRPAAEPPGAGWPGRTRAGPAASRREKKKTHGGRSAAMCLALRLLQGRPPRPRRGSKKLLFGVEEGGRGPRAAPGGPRRASPLLWPGSSATVAGGDRPRPRGRRALVSGAVGPNSRKTACRKPRGTASRMDQLCERIERGRHSELWENARGTRACKWFGHGPRLPTRGFAASPLANTPWARLRYR